MIMSFDIDDMKRALESIQIDIPKHNTVEERTNWLYNQMQIRKLSKMTNRMKVSWSDEKDENGNVILKRGEQLINVTSETDPTATYNIIVHYDWRYIVADDNGEIIEPSRINWVINYSAVDPA